tara:strand:- start:1055 stop:1507 length:453 start_codon:yes stop_codon:yes gene_type:complete
MQILSSILGYAADEPFDSALHDLSHAGKVEYLTISPDDTSRRRMRAITNKGTECAIVLNRDQQLSDGAVLNINDNGAIVVRLTQQKWLILEAQNHAAALEVGYFIGNLHWKVEFEGERLKVALQGPLQTYLDRLELLIKNGKVRAITEND